MAIRPCPFYGVHRMKPANKPAVKDYRTYDDVTSQYGFGYHSSCDCGEHFICSGNPQWNTPTAIRYYVHGSSIKSFSSYGGVYTAFIDTNEIYYSSSAYKEGWNFQTYS